jgi:hypothetical protein
MQFGYNRFMKNDSRKEEISASKDSTSRSAALIRAATEAQKVWEKIEKRREEREIYELRTAARKISPA